MKKVLFMLVAVCLGSAAEAKSDRSGWNAAFDLLRQTTTGTAQPTNTCLSPLSLQMALAMVNEGAAGKTRAQLGRLLPGNIDQLTTHLAADATLTSANSIWINHDFASAVHDSFAERNRQLYGAEIRVRHFGNQLPVEMNDWCNEHTHGLIPGIIDHVDKQDKMLLVNALYFRAEWCHQFETRKTKEAPFHREDGASVQVPMMHETCSWEYAENNLCQCIVLPYACESEASTRYSMYILLPRPELTLQGLLSHLDARWMKRLKLSRQRVQLQLPKWECSVSTDLAEPLKQMGITRPFTSDAEFTGISNAPLSISQILQKTRIRVDESGTEAAAVTMVGMLGAAPQKLKEPKQMIVNRPFIWVLVETESMTPVFVGTTTF